MDLKRIIRLAVVAGLFFGLANAAFTQSRFIVSSSPRQVQQTGVTEAVGDILLTSSDPGPSPTIPAGTSLSISFIPFSAAITNDPIVNNTNLIIETPPAFVPSPVPGAALAVGALSNSLIISFFATVPVPLGTRLRIRGVRLNIQASGITFPGEVLAQLTVSLPDAMRFNGIHTVGVAAPRPTISVAFPEPPGMLLQCLPGSVTRRVVLSEQSSAVFTSIAQENTFSSTPPPTNPTRIEVQLNNVPGGLTIIPPVSAELRGGSSATPPSLTLNFSLSQMSRLTSAATRDILLTYDITGEPDLSAIERTLFPGEVGFFGSGFDFTFTTTGFVSTQALGAAGIQVRLAPVSTTLLRARFAAGCPNPGIPSCVVPRFIDPLIPIPARPLVNVVGCTCNLKFVYATNKAGFDTGIVIANTTQDPYGTPAQSGAVTLYFYGQDAPTPPSLTTPVIPPGGSFTGLLSELAPDFQGYIIAVAGFQFCKGYAYIADSDFANIAHGYTALVIPDPVQLGRRVAGFVTSGTVNLGGTTGTITIQDALGERLLR